MGIEVLPYISNANVAALVCCTQHAHFSNSPEMVPTCSEMTRWLAEKAEALGVEIYPGFAASEVLYERGAVAGVATNDLGTAKDGSRKDTFARGVELRARATLFGEGCRGSLSQVRASSIWNNPEPDQKPHMHSRCRVGFHSGMKEIQPAL